MNVSRSALHGPPQRFIALARGSRRDAYVRAERCLESLHLVTIGVSRYDNDDLVVQSRELGVQRPPASSLCSWPPGARQGDTHR